jgi:hypothetical protein
MAARRTPARQPARRHGVEARQSLGDSARERVGGQVNGQSTRLVAMAMPTEAINGRLEALHGNALGFRNLTHTTESDPYCTAATSPT